MALTTEQIKFKVLIDEVGKNFKFFDETDIEGSGSALADYKGAIAIFVDGVEYYNKLAELESNPDIDGNSPGQVNENLTRLATKGEYLSLPLEENGDVVEGIYEVFYSVSLLGELITESSVKFTFIRNIEKGVLSYTYDLKLTDPKLELIDNTNYNHRDLPLSISRVISLFPPADKEGIVKTSTEKQLIAKSFYSGFQLSTLRTQVTWDLAEEVLEASGANFSVYYQREIIKNVTVEVAADTTTCAIFCCLKDFGDRLMNSLDNPSEYQELRQIAGEVSYYALAIMAAYECGKTGNVGIWAKQLRELVDCDENCGCSDGESTLIEAINGDLIGYSLKVTTQEEEVIDVTEINFTGATITNNGAGKVTVTIENSPTLTVTDGVTTVNTIDNITFTGATVTDNGGGDVTVEITGGGSVDSVNGQTGVVILTTTNIEEGTDANYVTDAQLVVIANTSGTNTGDQDLSGVVPYTGATTSVNLGEHQLSTGQVTFDQTPTQAAGVGVLRWNDLDGTLDLGLKGGNVTLQVGQEEVIRVVNKTGANLLESNFRAVRVRTVAEGGAQGQRLAVVLAQANSDLNSATTIGLVTENTTNNEEGFITTVGNVNGINTTGAQSFTGTEDWQDGDILYLDPDHAGYLTNIKPITPAHLIVIGYVVYSHAVEGKIYVKVDNGYELEELHDVLITDITNREILQWNGIESHWQNATLAEAGIQPAGSYATAAQGALADTAVQPADLSAVATSGSFLDLEDLPNTLSGYGITDAATSAQGSLADTALQSGDNVTELTNNAGYTSMLVDTSYSDLVSPTQSIVFNDTATVVTEIIKRNISLSCEITITSLKDYSRQLLKLKSTGNSYLITLSGVTPRNGVPAVIDDSVANLVHILEFFGDGTYDYNLQEA